MLVFSLFWFGCSLATNERAARLNNSNAMLYLITTNLEAITLTAKLLAMICLPITIAFLWKRATRTAWICLYAALGAATINAIARIPLGQFVTNSSYLMQDALKGYIITFEFALVWLIYALVRESIRWLVLRYPGATIKTWREGVLFGLSYSAIATIFSIPKLLYQPIIQTAYDFDAISTTEVTPHYRIFISLAQTTPFPQVADTLNDRIPWVLALVIALKYSLIPIIFNVGTSLAVLYSVRHKKAWPFAAALFCYIVIIPPGSIGMSMKINEIIKATPILSAFFGSLYEFSRPLGLLPFALILDLFPYLPALLPPLALTLYIRKVMANTQAQKT